MNKKQSLFLVLSLCILLSGCSPSPKQSSPYNYEVYFSPNGNVRTNIIKAIDKTTSSIDLAIFDLTSQDIQLALEKAKNRGVKIRIIADSRQAKGKHSVVRTLVDESFNIKITHGVSGGIMHNKFCIFDKKLLFTGSYNWTDNAEKHNYENALFLNSPEIIKEYQKEFDKIWSFS